MLPLRFAVSVKLGFNHFCWHLCLEVLALEGNLLSLLALPKMVAAFVDKRFTLNDFKGIQLSTPINPTLSPLSFLSRVAAFCRSRSPLIKG